MRFTLPLTESEKAEITTGSYFLLLMLAEMEVRGLPEQHFTEEHRQQLKRALTLLHRADDLGVRTRAIHLYRARFLGLLGEVEGAKRETELARRPATDLSPQDHFLVGYEHYSQGELAPAIQEFSQALQINGEHFWTHYFLGLCYVMSGKPDVAVAYLTTCQKQRKDLIWIYMLRGYALGQMKNYPAAESDFAQALSLKPPRVTRYVLLTNRGVMRVLQTGRLPLLGMSTAALFRLPGRLGPLVAASALVNLARAKGMDDLNQAARLFPDRHEALNGLAVAYQLDGRLGEARQKLDQAIEAAQKGDLKPERLAELHYSSALLHLQHSGQETTLHNTEDRLGENQPPRAVPESPSQHLDRHAALRDLEKAAVLAQNDRLRALVEADRGRLLHLQQQFVGAQEAYGKALKADPNRVVVHLWQGEVLFAEASKLEESNMVFLVEAKNRKAVMQKYRDAADAFSAYLSREGTPSVAVYQQRGQALAKLDQHSEAIFDFSRALKAKPTDKEKARLHLARGQEYLKITEPKLALDDFENVHQLDTENADAYLGRAHAWMKLEDPYKAVADADKAVKRNPKDPRLWLGAARVYALAAAHLQAKPAQTARQAEYEKRARMFLRTAIRRVPTEQRPVYWREYVVKDKALYPIGSRIVNP